MIKEIFRNYEAFYTMVLSTTIMSNAQTAEFKDDADKIIRFIGEAYKMDEKLIDECRAVILERLISLGLITDQQAVYSSRAYGENFTEEDALFDIKGDVLSRLQHIQGSDMDINDGWFDYTHYKTYQADVRFAKINITSAFGNLIATRQVGILKMLGIGCEADGAEAIKRLTQCVIWGDIPSMYLLGHAYSLSGKAERSEMFYGVAELSKKYLYGGYTVLPDEEKKKYSEETRNFYTYISTIKQDIVYAYNKANIDFSFIEAITSDTLDYFQRMEYINNYEKKAWKNVTNSSAKPFRKLGFI